jgi:hypothetical protein
MTNYKLTNEDKFKASTAMLQGDSFRIAASLMFMLDGNYHVVQTIGPADKCKHLETVSWTEALETFEMWAFC